MIYLDHAATTPLSPHVKQYIYELLDCYGNPSSQHQLGRASKKIIEQARKNIANFISAPDKSSILFTPSGSAANTLAIAGYYRRHNCTVLYSPTAHKSVLKCAECYHHSYPLKVDNQGIIDLDDLKEWLDRRQINPFIILEYANSEIGTIQPVKEIIDLVHFYNGIVCLDCTGSIPAIPLNVKSLNVDMAVFSGHKLGALKGIGVLYKKSNIDLEPIIYGSQEQGLCSGTENQLGIASLSKAVEYHDYSSITSESRDYVYNFIRNEIPDSYIIGAPIESGKRLPHNLYVCFPGISGESLLILLDMNGICVSTGSACTSGDLTPSSALTAIGMDSKDMNSCIRLSFNGDEKQKNLDYVCQRIKHNAEQLRSLK